MKVRLTKLSNRNGPTWRDTGDLQVGYTFSGRLVGDLVKGQPITVDRRAVIKHALNGIFTSSPIEEKHRDGGSLYVTTSNSVWKIDEVGDDTQP